MKTITDGKPKTFIYYQLTTISEYIEDKFDDTLVYDKNTNMVNINNDITIKWILLNSIKEKTKEIVQGSNKTAFE